MKPSISAVVGCATLIAALAGCSSAKDAADATTTGSTSTVAPAASTTSATASPSTTASASTTSSAAGTTTSSPTGTSTSAPMVGGMTECTKTALTEPATAAAQALGADNLYTVDTLNCADGWAVTAGILSSKQNPGMGAPTSFVFQQEGQFWVLQDKAKVCGTNPVTTTPPADAAIPAALFLSGCAAG